MEDGSIIIDSSIDTAGVETGTDDLKDILKTLISACEKLQKSMLTLSNTMAKGFKDTGATAQDATEDIKKLGEEAKKAKKQAKELEDIKINRMEDVEAVPDEPRTVELTGNKGYSVDPQKFLEAEKAADNLKMKAEELKESLVKLEESGKYFDNSDAYQEMYLELQNVNGQIREYRKNLDEVAYGSKLDNLENELESLRNKTRNLTEETWYYTLQLEQLSNQGRGFGDAEYDEVYQDLMRAKTAEKEYQKSLSGTNKAVEKSSKSNKKLSSILKTLSRSLKSIAVVSLRTSKNLLMRGVRAAVKGVTNGFNKLTSAIRGTNKESHRMSVKRMLGMSLLMGIMFQAFMAVQNAIKEGFINLSQYSNETNKSLSMLLSALTQLKNSIITAFAPLVTAVAPILTKFINLMSQAITYVGMFIASLTGKTTFTKAKKVQQDFAETYGETADSASDATDSINDQADSLEDAAKEAEGYLSPIDEINKLQKDIADTPSNSATPEINTPSIDGGLSPDDMFEEVAIDSAISDFVQRLKDLFRSGDFEEIGRILGEKINDAVRKITDFIDWDNCGAVITKFINNFCDFFNGLIATIDWYAIGEMFGTGINTLVNTLYLLLTGIDWELLGASLAQGIYGLFDKIEWDKLGETIAAGFNAAINYLYGFVEQMNSDGTWVKIGDSLAEGVMSIVNGIELEKFAYSLASLINGAISTVHTFITGIEWGKVGKKIANSLNTFFSNFNWIEAGMTFSDCALSLLELLINTVKETDWELFGKGVSDMLAAIKWKEIFSDLWKLVKDVFSDGFGGFLTGLTSSEPGKIISIIGEILLAVGVAKIVLGFIGDISNALGGTQAKGALGGAVTILKTFLNGKNGIGGLFAADGVFGGIGAKVAGALSGVGSAITGAFGAIASALGISVGGLVLIVVGAVAAIVFTLTHWDEIKTFFTETIPNWWNNTIVPFITGIKDWVVNKTQELKDGVVEKFNVLKTNIGEAWNAVKTATTEKWTSIKTTVTNAASNLATGAKNKISDLKTSTVNWWSNLKSDTASKWGDMKKSVTDSASKIKGGTLTCFKSIKTNVPGYIKSVANTVVDKFSDMLSGSDKIGQITDVFQSAFEGIVNFVRDPINSVIGFLNGLIGAVESAVNAVANMLNGMSFDAPDWVTNLTGISSIGFSLPTWSAPRVPYLAQGTVVPRRAGEFAAILGDNNKEPEVVSPLSTIEKAVENVIGRNGNKGGGYQFTAVLGRRVLFEEFIEEAKLIKKTTGKNPLTSI